MKAKVNTFLRSPELWDQYQAAPPRSGCFMCDLPADVQIRQEFTHWLIIANQYPYDTVASTHDLLIPRRHFAKERDATRAEADEALEILYALDQSGYYDSILKNFVIAQSQRDHFHYHLLTWKRR